MAKKMDVADSMKYLSNFVISGGDKEPSANIPTGYFNLDFAIHYGENPAITDLNSKEGYDPEVTLGLPLGKLCEFFGEEGGGKSYLAYRVCANAQKLGYNTCWIDAEQSFSRSLAEINGCNVSDLQLISTAQNNMYAEDVIDFIVAVCEAEKVPKFLSNGKKILVDPPKVIVVDSVASLIPKDIGEKMADKNTVALLARMFSQHLMKVVSAAEKNNVLVIFINQLREKVGIMFGNPEQSPGGRALRHAFSVRLKLTKRKNKDAQVFRIDNDSGREILIGGISYVNIAKNRFGKPFNESIDIPIYYEQYFPNIEDIIFDTGRQLKLISVRKGIFSFEEIKIEGRKSFIEKIREENMLGTLLNAVKEKAEEIGTILPPEIQKYHLEDEHGGVASEIL